MRFVRILFTAVALAFLATVSAASNHRESRRAASGARSRTAHDGEHDHQHDTSLDDNSGDVAREHDASHRAGVAREQPAFDDHDDADRVARPRRASRWHHDHDHDADGVARQ